MSKRKIAIGCVSLVLLLAMVIVLVSSALFDGIGSKKNTVVGEKAIVYDIEGNELEQGKIYPLSSAMSFVPTSLSTLPTEVTVSVIPTPSYAVSAKIDWSIAWVDDTDSWAVGKVAKNYVDVVAVSDGAYVATVIFKQVFGSQIKLVASVRDIPSINATCEIDCYGRIADIYINADIWATGKGIVPFVVGGGETVIFTHQGNFPIGKDDIYIVNDFFIYEDSYISLPVEYVSILPADNSYTKIGDYSYSSYLFANEQFNDKLNAMCGTTNEFVSTGVMLDRFSMKRILNDLYNRVTDYESARSIAMSIMDTPIARMRIGAVSSYDSFYKNIDIYLNQDWLANIESISFDVVNIDFVS